MTYKPVCAVAISGLLDAEIEIFLPKKNKAGMTSSFFVSISLHVPFHIISLLMANQ